MSDAVPISDDDLFGVASTMPAKSRFTILSRGLRRKRGEMNKTERDYAEFLNIQQASGLIWGWWYEPMTLRLSHPPSGQPAKYTPDFMVLAEDGITFLDDVKGAMVDNAAIVRAKAAAELYPLWRFRIAEKRRKRDGGGFDVREV